MRGAYLIYEDISEQIKASEAQRQHAESLNQLVKELELRTKQMTSLNEMGSLLECSGTVKDACAVVANSVQKLFPDALLERSICSSRRETWSRQRFGGV